MSSETFLSSLFPDLNWALSRQVLAAKGVVEGSKVVERIMESPRIKSAVSEAVKGEWSTISTKEAEEACRQVAEGMAANVHPGPLKAAGYVLRKAFRQMYKGIFYNEEGLERIRIAQSKGPVILLPNHRSHIDYIILSYILVTNALEIPFVIAGENLNFPLVGRFLHNSAAVFIRRKFGDDSLYKAVFYEYLSILMQERCTIECFIEGGRTRSGKLGMPKIGFMKAIVDLFEEGHLVDGDLSIIPVGISYDRVVESNSYVNEMLGQAKQPESLSGFLASINNLLMLNFGTIDVCFGEPLSLRSIMQQSQYPKLSSGKRLRFLKYLTHRVMYECNRITVLPVSSVVSTVLLTTFNRGIHIKQLVSRVERICEQLKRKGAKLSKVFDDQNSVLVIEQCLRLLGKMVKRRNNVVFGFQNVESLELSFYRNQLLHWFVSESLVSVAMCSFVQQTEEPSSFTAPSTFNALNIAVPSKDLLEAVKFASKLLKFEFVYKPAPDIEDNFEETIQDLQSRGLFSRDSSNCVSVCPQAEDSFYFLCMLIWPFIDVYWVTGMYLSKSLDVMLQKNELSKVISAKAENLYYEGQIDFYESISVDSIGIAINWFVSEKLVTVNRMKDKKGEQKLIQVTRSDAKQIDLLVQRIGSLRKAFPSRSYARVVISKI